MPPVAAVGVVKAVFHLQPLFNVCLCTLQEFDGAEFLECIKDLVRLDKDWVPKAKDCSLYIRPTFIGTQVTRERGGGAWGWDLSHRRKGMVCEGWGQGCV